MMISSMRQTIQSTRYRLQMLIPSVTMFVFLTFAFLIATMIVLSIIPIYLEDNAVAKTNFILTTVRMTNYTLYMSRSLGKRQLTSAIRAITGLTTDEARMTMNASIQYALEQQLKAGDNRDKFHIYILQMTPYTDNPSNMSIIVDFLVMYTQECISCNKHRQSNIFQQLCSNTLLSNPIRFLTQYTNFSYVLSDPITVYTTNIPIDHIQIITQIVSTSQFLNPITTIGTNGSTQISNKLLANNYTLTVTTSKSNYFATLDETGTQISASQNDGPIPLLGASSMYPSLMQIIERQMQSPNGSNGLNITINHIIIQFWYSNSTVRILIDFLINFSIGCDSQCMNQRSYQLGNLTNTSINIQPANLTDGQVRIPKNGIYVLFNYSLTTQVITNFTGTIIYASPPTFTNIY